MPFFRFHIQYENIADTRERERERERETGFEFERWHAFLTTDRGTQVFKQVSACIIFFIIIVSGVRLSPLGTATTTGLLYHPQMIDVGDCGAIGGMKIGRGNLPQRHILHHKSHMTRPWLEPGPPRWEASD
jgi:hypothetical protein